jgi:hypothetical protein
MNVMRIEKSLDQAFFTCKGVFLHDARSGIYTSKAMDKNKLNSLF